MRAGSTDEQYLLELRQIEQFKAGQGPAELVLPLLNQRWVRAPKRFENSVPSLRVT